MTKTEQILTSVTGRIIAPLRTDENKGNGKARHNCDVNRIHSFNATEFMMNNTVKRLVQAQGYKNGYKLIQTCKASDMPRQIERVQIFVNICQEMNEDDREFDGIATFAEERLREFAERVDGVVIDRQPVSDIYWHANPGMIVTETL